MELEEGERRNIERRFFLVSWLYFCTVPPLSARHLQEAIVESTLMYGSEVSRRGQKFSE